MVRIKRLLYYLSFAALATASAPFALALILSLTALAVLVVIWCLAERALE